MTKNVTKNGIDHEYQQFKTQNTNTNKLSEQSFDLNNGIFFSEKRAKYYGKIMYINEKNLYASVIGSYFDNFVI